MGTERTDSGALQKSNSHVPQDTAYTVAYMSSCTPSHTDTLMVKYHLHPDLSSSNTELNQTCQCEQYLLFYL